MSARKPEALAVLARLGLDPAALAGGAPPADWLRERLDAPDGGAFADALGELGTASTAEALVALVPTLSRKAARKAVRRALFRLGQRGVAVPPVPDASEPPVRPLLAADEIEGLVSAVDGRGDRIVWLVKTPPGGTTLVIAADLNEPAGLRDVRLFETTRRQLRETRTRLERETGMRLVAADWRALDALLLEGEDRAGGERGRDYRRLRPRLTTAPPAPAVELRSSRVRPPDDDEAEALAHAALALFAEPELRSWWPSPEQAQPFLAELAQLRDSPLVLAEQQQQERIRGVMARAASALFPSDTTARRLEATAYVLAETGRGRSARQALATVSLLRRRSALAAEVPLIAALVQQGLGALYAASQEERAEARRGSLVLTPGEALTDRSPSHRGRTPG